MLLHNVVFVSALDAGQMSEETKMADESGEKDAKKKTSEKPIVPRNPTEIQKMKLEKLMKDPVSL